MIPDIKWLDNPEVFRMNQLAAHSDHKWYESQEAYEASISKCEQCLNGTWKFQYSENATSRPIDFYKEGFDSSEFSIITVPQHIEMAGYDKIHYINTMYPWEGHVYRRPAYTQVNCSGDGMFSEAEYNPVGSYLCKFDLEESLRGHAVHIGFAGVEQAMYVWLNGSFVGYAEDSFTLSEFNLTPYIRDAGNVLAVEVHKRCAAAFIEGQDFFRFFGIFRDVTLYAIPEIHVEDMWVRPDYDMERNSGSLEVDLKFKGEQTGHVECSLWNGEVLCWQETQEIKTEMRWNSGEISDILPWSNHTANLYLFLIKVYNREGNMVEIVPYSVGFRKLEMRNKVMYLNGARLIINGVNRHEWSAEHGRCITEIEEQRDIQIIKRNHINAVRTSHYPNRQSWYDICDREGIYLMAENNLESHGSWQKQGLVEPSWNVPGSIPQWEAMVLDRVRTNFHMFKNHVSVLFWSIGNEAYAGDVLVKAHELYKELDDSRMVHYEGVFWNPIYKDRISDMESHMYSSPEAIEAYLNKQPEKPFILCEYMHNMGNSMGGLNSYMELLDKYPMYQGGFIWDFIDQAIQIEDEITGKQVLRYGGDFDDRPSNYEFSGNGILFADRTEKPAMQEVRYFYGKYR